MLKKFVGEWNTKTIVAVAIGAALYGVLMVWGSIPVFTNTNLTSAMIVPVVVGALFGPLPATVALLVGNCLADLIGGWGFWFDWSLGNFVTGYFAGLVGAFGADVDNGVFTTKHAIIHAVLCIVGCAIGFGLVTPLLTYLWYSSELTITWVQAQAAIISDASVLIVVGIPVLYALARRNARGTNLSKED